jgi:hypothetical protein
MIVSRAHMRGHRAERAASAARGISPSAVHREYPFSLG